jgi:membrane protein DedA with SNARE-associated domain
LSLSCPSRMTLPENGPSSRSNRDAPPVVLVSAMSDVLVNFKPYLDQYGLWAVFGAILLEDFGVPLPGETLLIAGALLASQGTMRIVPLLLIAWAGAVTGDNIGYAIGRFGGRRLVQRYGPYLLISERRLEYAEAFFRRRGGVIVVAARFFAVLRQLNGLIAGIARMPWWQFLPYNAIGAALWVGFWGTLFYQLGGSAMRIGLAFKKLQFFLIGGVVVAAAAVIVYWWRRSKQ